MLYFRALVLVWLCLALPSWSQIFTENAGTVSPETPTLREMLSVLRSQGLDEIRLEQSLSWSWEVGQELRLLLPTTARRLSYQGRTRQSLGLGDAQIRYKRVLSKEDDVMASERLAWIAELTLPSGQSPADLPVELRNGMGAFWLGTGLVYTSIYDRQRFSLEAKTRWPGSSSLPREADLSLAYWYRLTPAEFGEDEVELRGVLELLNSHRWGGDFPGMRGTLIWLAPGLQIYSSPEVQFELALLVPLTSLQDGLGRRDLGASGTFKIQF